MKTVILWIGNYKTGSSFQQALFFHNAELLRDAGIYYPKTPPYKASHAVVAPWFPRIISDAFYQGASRQAFAEELVQSALADPGTETVLLHSEVFARFIQKPDTLEELRALFGDDTRFRVIFTVRRVEDMRSSLVNQMLKMGTSQLDVSVYFDGTSPISKDHMRLCDYPAIIALYERVFGAEVEVVQYEDLSRAPEGFARASFEVLGPGLVEGREIALPSEKESNPSPSPIPAWIARQVSDDRWQIARIATALAKQMGLEDPRSNTLLTQDDYAQFQRDGDAVNAALAARAARLDQVFTPAPSAKRSLVFRDEIDFEKWRAVAETLTAEPAPQSRMAALMHRAKQSLKHRLSKL